MTSEQNQSEETAPTTSEEASAQTDDAPQATPVLNRAERRAQSKGKKGGASAPSNPGQTGNVNARTSGNRIGGAVGQNRLPRTGNK